MTRFKVEFDTNDDADILAWADACKNASGKAGKISRRIRECAPPPPLEEPTGLGAVVEAAGVQDGRRRDWVRVTRPGGIANALSWYNQYWGFAHWEDLKNPNLIDEGTN